jgi:hypothetical protein
VDERARIAVTPSRGLAAVVAALLLVRVGTSFVQRIASGQAMADLDGLRADQRVAPPAPAGWTRAVGAVGSLSGLLLIILFLVWFSSAYKAALAHGTATGGTTGRVTAWLVPVLNLVLCFSAVSAIWRAGGREGDRRGLLVAWWTAWSASVATALVGVVVAIASLVARLGDVLDAQAKGEDASTAARLLDVGDQRLRLTLGLVSGFFIVAAAILAAAFVVAATDRLRDGSAFADRAGRWTTGFALAAAGAASIFVAALGTGVGLAA